MPRASAVKDGASDDGSSPQPSATGGGAASTPSPERRASLQAVLDAWRSGRWVLAEELGHGSSGVVLRSSDTRLGQVAIKFTHGADPQTLEREAALMQRVAHPHICKLYEHRASSDGQLFAMVVELLHGGSLAGRIKEGQDGRVREFEVIRMAFDILAGLGHMHTMGVIHRDGPPPRPPPIILSTWPPPSRLQPDLPSCSTQSSR
eukprot:COSAG04_NODE_8822_length_927_cov_1.364734_1_plen_204_part_01